MGEEKIMDTQCSNWIIGCVGNARNATRVSAGPKELPACITLRIGAWRRTRSSPLAGPPQVEQTYSGCIVIRPSHNVAEDRGDVRGGWERGRANLGRGNRSPPWGSQTASRTVLRRDEGEHIRT